MCRLWKFAAQKLKLMSSWMWGQASWKPCPRDDLHQTSWKPCQQDDPHQANWKPCPGDDLWVRKWWRDGTQLSLHHLCWHGALYLCLLKYCYIKVLNMLSGTLGSNCSKIYSVKVQIFVSDDIPLRHLQKASDTICFPLMCPTCLRYKNKSSRRFVKNWPCESWRKSFLWRDPPREHSPKTSTTSNHPFQFSRLDLRFTLSIFLGEIYQKQGNGGWDNEWPQLGFCTSWI